MFNILFGILDFFFVLIFVVGDLVVWILEVMGLSVCGIYGIIVVFVLFNDVVKKGGMMVLSVVGGLSGVFIFVLEDEGMIFVVE